MTDRLRSVKHDGLSTRLVLEVPLNGNLDKVLRLLVDTLRGNGGDNSQVIEAINNLSRKVDTFMATQEERLQAIFGQLTEAVAGINTLRQQLDDLKANNPGIEDEIAAIEGTVTEIRDALPGVPPTDPAPGPEA